MSRPIADNDPFRGIAHPIRRRVLDLLRKGPMSPGELFEHFQTTWPNLSHHLRVLRQSGLVTQRRVGRRRVYRVDTRRFRAVATWTRDYDKSR